MLLEVLSGIMTVCYFTKLACELRYHVRQPHRNSQENYWLGMGDERGAFTRRTRGC